MADLSDCFAEQRSNVINWRGVPTFGLIEFDELPSQVALTFITAKAHPVQGVRLKMQNGALAVNGHKASNIVLWRDSAPLSVRIDVEAARRENAVLKLWNVWRGGLGVTQAWLGNAAIQVDGDLASGTFHICCSDGEGAPSFDDLVVLVETV